MRRNLGSIGMTDTRQANSPQKNGISGTGTIFTIRFDITAGFSKITGTSGDIIHRGHGKTAGLVGGMGIASCAEIGDHHGLFQPAHGSAPDIMGQDRANPLATILSGALLLEYLAERLGDNRYADAAMVIEAAVEQGFTDGELRPMEFGGTMGTDAMTRAVLNRTGQKGR